MDSYQQSQSEPPTIWRTPDELWQRLALLLVVDKPRKKPGRPRTNDRRIKELILAQFKGTQGHRNINHTVVYTRLDASRFKGFGKD